MPEDETTVTAEILPDTDQPEIEGWFVTVEAIDAPIEGSL